MRVLLAEDSMTSLTILRTAVESLGHECVTARDGDEAWERWRDSAVETVISDWLMPGLDGDELCRRIREVPDAPYTYFIMLTGLEDKESVVQAMHAGVDDYLTKPLDRSDLEVRLIAAARVTALHRTLHHQQQAIEHEVRMAAGIQRGLLPGAAPPVPGASVAGRCVPAAQVGGDYFDHVLDREGRLVMVVADVAGHSIGSALLMAMARGALRRSVAAGESPAAVLHATNQELFDDLVSAELFITMFCARVDPSTGTLEYANAGHNAPCLRLAGEVHDLDADGAAVGILEDVEFEERSVEMGLGDGLLLYTDGIVEAADSTGAPFGDERLRRLAAIDRSPVETIEAVLREVRGLAPPGSQSDDMTLLAFRLDTVAR